MPPFESWSRRRATVSLISTVACLLVGSCVLQGFGVMPVSRSSERQGPFDLRYATYDAFGHRATSKSFYYRKGLRRPRVAERVGSYDIDPRDSTRMLYERCTRGREPTCGIHFFDGRSGRNVLVGSHYPMLSSDATGSRWSPGGRAAILSGQFSVEVVNLATANSSDLSAVLALREMGPQLQRAEWSPDGRQLVLHVWEHTDPSPPYVNGMTDLILVDAETGVARYIATAAPRGWTPHEYAWVQAGSGYSLRVAGARPHAEGTIYRKTPAQLPPGLQPQP
jgi:hypothetical protein